MECFRRMTGIAALLADLSILATGCVIDLVDVDVDGGRSGEAEVSAAFSWNLPLEGRTGIVIRGINGSVVLSGVPGAETIHVKGLRRVRSDSRADARANLHRVQVSVASTHSLLEIRTRQPSHSDGRSYVVDYEIAVPAHLRAKITNGNGVVRLEGIRADVEIWNGNGNVELVDVVGSSWISVGNGGISARVTLPLGGQVVHSIGNGFLRLMIQSTVSATFGAKVGNGAIHVLGLSLEEVVSGPRQLLGILGTGRGRIDLSTGNGVIHVTGQ